MKLSSKFETHVTTLVLNTKIKFLTIRLKDHQIQTDQNKCESVKLNGDHAKYKFERSESL